MRWSSAVRLTALALFLGSAACSGCKGCDGCGTKEDPGSVVAEPPVPAPEGLLADVYAVSPDTSWGKLQRGVGGTAGILPATLPGIIVTMANLDVRIAFELDGTAPIYGVLAGDPASPSLCVAIKLTDPRRARMVLADGENALFGAREDRGLTHLVPRPGLAARDGAAAALTKSGHLVVGRTTEDLNRLAPYATRTLPTRSLPKDGAIVADVPRPAVEKVLAPKIESLWADGKAFLLREDERTRSEHGGRAPDFGDPKAIVAALDAVVGRRIAVFRDLDRVRLAFDVDDASLFLTATLTPRAAGGPAKAWIESMHVGNSSALLRQSSEAAFALSLHDSEADRAAQADELEKAIASSLGDRLKPDGQKRLHAAFEDWTKGRDETLTLAYSTHEPAGTFVTTHARDPEAAKRAVRESVELTRAPPFKELFRVKESTSAVEDVPGLGKVDLARFVRDSSPEEREMRAAFRRDAGAPVAAAVKKIGVAWSTEGGDVGIGIGAEPVSTLTHGLRPERKLHDEPLVSRFASNLGDTASVLAVFQPLRLDPQRANLPAAPVAVGLSKKDGTAVVRLDVSDALLREASRIFAGF